MALLKITAYGDPLLRRQAAQIEEIDEELLKLIDDLSETMKAADGVGLAAPQVGVSRRLFLIDWSKLLEEGGEVKAYLNPEILAKGSDFVETQEGCLSLPDVWADVERSDQITIRYQTVTGEIVEEELTEFPARVFQHENDHLLGILFIDHIPLVDRKKWQDTLQKIMDGEIKPFSGEQNGETTES